MLGWSQQGVSRLGTNRLSLRGSFVPFKSYNVVNSKKSYSARHVVAKAAVVSGPSGAVAQLEGDEEAESAFCGSEGGDRADEGRAAGWRCLPWSCRAEVCTHQEMGPINRHLRILGHVPSACRDCSEACGPCTHPQEWQALPHPHLRLPGKCLRCPGDTDKRHGMQHALSCH